MKKAYFLIVLFLSGLSVGNVFAAASAAAAVEDDLGQELINAAMIGDKAEVARLIAAGANVNAHSVGNVFAAASAADYLGGELREAAREGDEKKVERLIAAGADVNASGPFGDTALMEAVKNGDADMVNLLLQKEGIKVNAQDLQGNTALMNAAMKGNADMVKLLLSRGADKTIKYRGKTAESLARRNYPKLADYIRDFGSGRLTKAAGRRN